MSLWIAFAALLVVALIGIVAPLIRARSGGPADHNALVYQDQLLEIDSDVERGLLSTSEADALKAEINRRLHKSEDAVAAETTDTRATPETPETPKSRTPNFAPALAVIVIIPLAALGLYRHLGSPDKPDLPFAERKFANPVTAANAEMTRLVNELQKRMEKNPDKIEGWLLLGRSLVSQERYQEASEAFARAFKLDPSRAELAASAAETGFLATGGEFTLDVRHYFQTALKLNPREHKALYYLGLDLANQKKYGEAIQNWVDLIAISPVGAPWLNTVRERLVAIAEAGKLKISDFKPRLATINQQQKQPGPTQEDVKAAGEMSGEDRQAFIRSMVNRLAERLKSEPGDVEGWRRLARAYQVLGETEKAAEIEARLKALTK